MHLQNLSIINFKNYSVAELNFCTNINCFVGNNGVGKTNLLDAIYYLSVCKSYFNPIDSQNINHTAPYFLIQGQYLKNDSIDTAICGLKRNQKKIFKLNTKEYERLADHIGQYPLVMISPADIDLISAGSEDRRLFLNAVISQYDKEYLFDEINYKKCLMHRNSLLKQFTNTNHLDKELFELIDEKMISLGYQIYEKRKNFITDFIPIFQHYYKFISAESEDVSIIYQSQLSENNFKNALAQSLEKDKILQYTSVGTHKDDLIFHLNGFPIKKMGSQGQKKSLLIALALAKFDQIKKVVKFNPILLLDDIFDKLDDLRVKKIIELVGSHQFGQIFITDTSKDRIVEIMHQISENYKIFQISNTGEVTVISE